MIGHANDVTLGDVLNLLEHGDRQALIRIVASKMRASVGQTPEDAVANVLTGFIAARVGTELVARGGFEWSRDVGRSVELRATNGEMFDLFTPVEAAVRDAAQVAPLREKLRSLGLGV